MLKTYSKHNFVILLQFQNPCNIDTIFLFVAKLCRLIYEKEIDLIKYLQDKTSVI